MKVNSSKIYFGFMVKLAHRSVEKGHEELSESSNSKKVNFKVPAISVPITPFCTRAAVPHSRVLRAKLKFTTWSDLSFRVQIRVSAGMRHRLYIKELLDSHVCLFQDPTSSNTHLLIRLIRHMRSIEETRMLIKSWST